MSSSQDQRRSRGPVTVGEPLPQTFGIVVTIERVTGTISSGCRRPRRDQVGSRGRAEPGVLGAVIGLAARVRRPADSVITSPGSGIRVIAPRLDSRRLQLDRTPRHVATEHYSPQSAASAGQMDAHCISLSWSSHHAGRSRCSAYGPLPHSLSGSSLMLRRRDPTFGSGINCHRCSTVGTAITAVDPPSSSTGTCRRSLQSRRTAGPRQPAHVSLDVDAARAKWIEVLTRAPGQEDLEVRPRCASETGPGSGQGRRPPQRAAHAGRE